MSTQDDEIRIGFALAMVRMSRRWRWKLDQRLRATGLTQARWTTLLQIARGGDGMQQHRLADHIGIEGPTLVRLLHSLEESGLVERRADPTDGRAKTIHLTAAATPVLAEIEQIADGLRQEMTIDIPPDELARCIAIFDLIQSRLDAADGDSGSRATTQGRAA
ncbi:MAG: MarR family transcriptional regulator [Minwuia sp.]|nr:MarR family transcriptional regulator [Minwuia sp.]